MTSSHPIFLADKLTPRDKSLKVDKKYGIGKIPLVVIGYNPNDEGKWIMITCTKQDCKNYGGYWSKDGQPQDRSYICEKHQK